MPCPHNNIGGSNGKVVCPRNTARTGHKNGIQQETGHKTEYSRRQDKETAGIPA